MTAAPYRSDDADAAVGEELGTLSVEVSAMYTESVSMPSSLAQICAILVCKPWPISTPPWVTRTVPSR